MLLLGSTFIVILRILQLRWVIRWQVTFKWDYWFRACLNYSQVEHEVMTWSKHSLGISQTQDSRPTYHGSQKYKDSKKACRKEKTKAKTKTKRDATHRLLKSPKVGYHTPTCWDKWDKSYYIDSQILLIAWREFSILSRTIYCHQDGSCCHLIQ